LNVERRCIFMVRPGCSGQCHCKGLCLCRANTVTGRTLRWIPFASQFCTKSVTNRSNRQCCISIAGQYHVEEWTTLEIKAQLICAVRASESNPSFCLLRFHISQANAIEFVIISPFFFKGLCCAERPHSENDDFRVGHSHSQFGS
jgi:hypothetical protein